MANELLLFTLDGCGGCKRLKERLQKESLPYREVEVGKNKEIWNKVIEQTGNEYLPAFYIKKDDTGKGPFFCPQKDFDGDDEALAIILKYIEKKEGGQ
jgi:glutaredoxin